MINSLTIRTQFRVKNTVIREALRKDKHAVYYQDFSLDQQWTKVSKDYVQVSGRIGENDNILKLNQTVGKVMRGSFQIYRSGLSQTPSFNHLMQDLKFLLS